MCIAGVDMMYIAGHSERGPFVSKKPNMLAGNIEALVNWDQRVLGKSGTVGQRILALRDTTRYQQKTKLVP